MTVTRTSTPSAQHQLPRAAFAGWVLLAALVGSACGKPEVGGPRGVAYRGNDDNDGGTEAATSCTDLKCEAPADCIESVENGLSRAVCACPQGYRNEGTTRCVDVDECASPDDNDCDANEVCENRTGTFGCRCKPGFIQDGETCKSLDACVGVANVCHPSAACTLDDGGKIACECSAGTTGNGRSCADVDECALGSDDCVDDATCTNTRDGYSCACSALFSGDGKVQCRDRCALAQADAARCDPEGNGRCLVDTLGVASCNGCAPGFIGDGRRCTANAECAALDCGANTDCTGNDGSRACECAPGFEGNPTTGCTDIDECETGAADCAPASSLCLNFDGGYLCDCKPGFERSGAECVNVNECERDLDLCDPNADCTDKTPGFECKCKAGFSGDGRSCADIDECENGDAQCPDGVSCVNKRGSFACECPPGLTSDGGGEACYCDITGVWAMRQDALLVFPEQSVAGNIILATSMNRASIWELYKLRYDGDKITVERKQCGVDVFPELYSPLYGETYSSGVPNEVYDVLPFMRGREIPLDKANALPGEKFETPLDATLSGIDLNDPVGDPWPARFQDVPAARWVDSDNDGEPGITLWPRGTSQAVRAGMAGSTYSYLPVALVEGGTDIRRRMGCASVALRGVGRFSVEIDSCSRFTGLLVDARTEGRVHSCTLLRESDWDGLDVTCTEDDWAASRPCSEDEVEFLDTQDQTNMSSATFELQKIGPVDAEDVDCEDVRMRLPAIKRN